MKTFIEVLSAGELEQIDIASFEVLETVGVEFHHPEALNIFRQDGSKVTDNRVFLSPEQVKKALDSVPESFCLEARNPSCSVQVGEAGSIFAPPVGCVYVNNYGEGRRQANQVDYLSLVKLIHFSRAYDLNGGGLVMPEFSPNVNHQEKFTWMLLAGHWYSDKPQLGFTLGGEVARASIEISEIVFQGQSGCRLLGIVNPDSPLVYSEKMLEGLMIFAKAGQPLILAPCSMAMTTSPSTLAGTLVQTNAEVLAGVVLTQLLKPGTPVIYGNTSTIADMQNMGIATGAAELSLLATATAQMARYYRLPSRTGGALTDAKSPDFQAGTESMLSMLASITGGANIIVHSGGILDSFLTLSFEKLILDEDLGGMAQRFGRGIEVNENSLAVSVIREVGPGRNFLTTGHTLANFRSEFFKPKLTDRQTYKAAQDYGNFILERAREDWQARLENYVRPELSPEVEKSLVEYYRARFGSEPFLP